MYQIGCSEHPCTVIHFNDLSEYTLNKCVAKILAKSLTREISQKHGVAMLCDLKKYLNPNLVTKIFLNLTGK